MVNRLMVAALPYRALTYRTSSRSWMRWTQSWQS